MAIQDIRGEVYEEEVEKHFDCPDGVNDLRAHQDSNPYLVSCSVRPNTPTAAHLPPILASGMVLCFLKGYSGLQYI